MFPFASRISSRLGGIVRITFAGQRKKGTVLKPHNRIQCKKEEKTWDRQGLVVRIKEIPDTYRTFPSSNFDVELKLLGNGLQRSVKPRYHRGSRSNSVSPKGADSAVRSKWNEHAGRKCRLNGSGSSFRGTAFRKTSASRSSMGHRESRRENRRRSWNGWETRTVLGSPARCNLLRSDRANGKVGERSNDDTSLGLLAKNFHESVP